MTDKEAVKINIDTIKKPYDVKGPKPKNDIKRNVRHSDRQLYRIYKTFVEPNILNKRNVEDENNLLNFFINKIKSEMPKKENKIDVETTGASLPPQQQQRQIRDLTDYEIREIEDEMSREGDKERRSVFFIEDDWFEEISRELDIPPEDIRGDATTESTVKESIMSAMRNIQGVKSYLTTREKAVKTIQKNYRLFKDNDKLSSRTTMKPDDKSSIAMSEIGTRPLIINPETGRKIYKNGHTHKNLISKGVLDIEGNSIKK